MHKQKYVPERGDLIWLTFDPQAGHEQAGTRPAIVISHSSYNSVVGLAIVCPITSRIKGYPFEVILGTDLEIRGAILCDQVKNLDWKVRLARFVCKAPSNILDEVLSKLKTVIE